MSCFKNLLLVVALFVCKHSVATSQHGCNGDLPNGFDVPNVPTANNKWNPSNFFRPQIGTRGTDSWAMFSVSQVEANGLWCQVRDNHTANMSSNIGDWYYPTPLNGTTLVPTSTNNAAPYLSLKCTNQIGLILSDTDGDDNNGGDNENNGNNDNDGDVNSVNTDYQGIVRCVTTVPNLSRQANYFGVYSDDVFSNYTGPVVNGSMTLHLLSSRAADSSIVQAKLTFYVSNGPPSKLVCTYQYGSNNESKISSFQIHREVIRAHYINSSLPDVTRIVLEQTITRRQGVYKCTVTVEGRSGIQPGTGTYERVTKGTPQFSLANITVAGTPTGVTAYRIGYNTVWVSWTAPSDLPTPAGYEVFYQTTTGSRLSAGNTSNTQLNISGLTVKENYTIFVVSFGEQGDTVLPSVHSDKVIVPAIPMITNIWSDTSSVMLSWDTSQLTPDNYIINYVCYRLCDSLQNSVKSNFSVVDGDAINFNISFLEAGSRCQVNMTATFGDDSNTATISTNTISAVPTGAPKKLTNTSVCNTSISVIWDPVSCLNQRGPITAYNLWYSNGADNISLIISGANNRTYEITGLTPSTTYTIAVAAVNDGGTGPYSDPPLTVWTPMSTGDSLPDGSDNDSGANGGGGNGGEDSGGEGNGGEDNGGGDNDGGDNGGGDNDGGNNGGGNNGGGNNGDGNNGGGDNGGGNTGTNNTGGNGNPIGGGDTITGPVVAVVIVIIIIILISVIIVVMVLIVMKRYRQQKTSKADVIHFINKEAIIYDDIDVCMTATVSEVSVNDSVALDNYTYATVSDTKKPAIRSFPEDMTTVEGKRVEFSVKVTGLPTPTLTWYHDNDRLNAESDCYEISSNGSLTIFKPGKNHSGTYRFVASNSEGSVENQLTLKVMTERVGDKDPDSTVAVYKPIPVSEFGQYVAQNHASSNKGFSNLFKSLPSGEEGHSVAVATSSTNKSLNRFKNITVYDDNRIVLQPIASCQSDYINASYIDGLTAKHKYIACQGPLSKTVVDFWRMVWQEHVHTVVMVTNLKENNKAKCHQYWPNTEDTASFGPFTVTLSEQQMFAHYTIRLLQLQLKDVSQSYRLLKQYHFTSWPDHGVPEYAAMFLNFYQRIKQEHKPSQGPLLVHCSAGVGRTGTLIAIDMILEMAEKEKLVDVSGVISKMRQQRMKMVQTSEQYRFIHDAILESIVCGKTQVNSGELRPTIELMKMIDPATEKTQFQTQFEVLQQVTPDLEGTKTLAAQKNEDKNRLAKYLPPDNHRVVLKQEESDYIHATFVNGYKHKKAFIIAQSPMEYTIKDFWKMIVERECTAVVMLCALEEDGQSVCHQYWSSTGSVNYGDLCVELVSEEQLGGYVERTLSVTIGKSGQSHLVTQFHIQNWSSNGECSRPQTIVTVVEEVNKVQRRTENRPIVVHCSDTVSRSGMFCAIATTIDRCKTEGVVDVFQVVKAQRLQKPGLVLTVEQYQFVFEAVVTFLESFETYSNFK